MQPILKQKGTQYTSKSLWNAILKEPTGNYLLLDTKEKRYHSDNTLKNRLDNRKKEQFHKKNELTTEILRGRVENIENDVIMVGFEVPEENRREYYPININQIGFEIKVNEIIEMVITRNKTKSKVEITFNPYEEKGFFQNIEEELRKKIQNIENLPEDEF